MCVCMGAYICCSVIELRTQNSESYVSIEDQMKQKYLKTI